MHHNRAWAVGYNRLGLPIAGGAFEPLGFAFRPELGAMSMAGPSVIVVVNAVALKRLRVADPPGGEQPPPSGAPRCDAAHVPATEPA